MYLPILGYDNYDKKEIIAFLRMVRLKERKLEWAFKEKEKGKKNKNLAFLCGVKIRRFQQLYAEYKMTRKIPQLNQKRRPKVHLTDEQKEIINKALKESLLGGALKLRLWIKKYYDENISRNKLHEYLLSKGISKEDKKKKKQRKYCKYEREHSFSLVHLDWHDSRFAKKKFVCTVEDDASRLILCGGEFDNEKAINNIQLMNGAIKFAYKNYSAVIRECNTDKGTQFYNSKFTNDGKRPLGEFELFLKSQGINHIPSRRNHPQTNGKKERWFRTYEENRHKFKSFDKFIDWYNNMIHLGLSRTEGITPKEAVVNKLQSSSILGLFLRLID